MIQYRNISAYMDAQHRLSRQYYSSFWRNADNTSKETDRLVVFTTERDARLDSRDNLAKIMDRAREVGSQYVIAKPNLIQAVGHRNTHSPRDFFGQDFFDELQEYAENRDRGSWLMPSNNDHQRSDRGHCTVSLRTYGGGSWVTPEDQGFYDIVNGTRVTNRREQIQALWQLGFASRRGRPVHVAQERWCGSRTELELLTQLADQHWDRRGISEAAKKMVSAYTSINRYVAWPGAW